MHVFLTGGTGFVGSYIRKELLAQGHTVRCLTRDPGRSAPATSDGIEWVKGDAANPSSLTGLIRGCDAVIHLVGIIAEQPSKGITFETAHYEATKHVVDEAVDAQVACFVHMSANGARPDGVSRYQTTKWKAEEYVRASALKRWTIFRPSVIFGDPGADYPEFATQLLGELVAPFPILPVFGDGQYLMQPISVQEVAAAFVQALGIEASAGHTYCTAGKERVPFDEVLDRIARGAGLDPKPKLHQPLFLARALVQTAGRLGLLPITPDQLEMLVEGNTCDNSDFYRDFEIEPTAFSPENLGYLRDPS